MRKFAIARVVKELRFEVNEDFSCTGFVDLVGAGIVNFQGKLRYFSERGPDYSEGRKFPAILHLKFKKTILPEEIIFSRHPQQQGNLMPAKDFTSGLTTPQAIVSLDIFNLGNKIIKIEGFSQPYYDFDFSTYTDPDNYLILEAKNIPGSSDAGPLKDVSFSPEGKEP